MHNDNDRSHHLYVRALLGACLFADTAPIRAEFLDAASSLDFRKREAEGHSGAKLFNRTPVHDGMAESDVEAEVILHLPNRADQAG